MGAPLCPSEAPAAPAAALRDGTGKCWGLAWPGLQAGAGTWRHKDVASESWEIPGISARQRAGAVGDRDEPGSFNPSPPSGLCWGAASQFGFPNPPSASCTWQESRESESGRFQLGLARAATTSTPKMRMRSPRVLANTASAGRSLYCVVPFFLEQGREAGNVLDVPETPPQTLQGSVQGATHLRKCSVPFALCWSLPNPAQIHILSSPCRCEGSSQAPISL